MIKLVTPTIEYADDIMEFRRELLNAGDVDSFAGCGDLEDCLEAKQWIDSIDQRKSEVTCPKGNVPSDTYIAVRESDNRIVGVIDLRHHIEHPVLSLWGGHMGYIVRPSERGKGYAKKMLKLNLENCRKKELKKVLITCNESNKISEAVILANGGSFEKNVKVDGEIIKRYWVTL